MSGILHYLPPVFCGLEYDAASANWAMDAWKVDSLRRLNNGKGVRVAVLDTGCDPTHPDLKDAIVASKDFTGSSVGSRDRNGHGTHCAGTVGARNPLIGVATGCELIIGKVLGDSGSGGDGGIAAGIDWAVEQGAHVISMSLGSIAPSRTIQSACDRASRASLIVAAAGNEGMQGVGYPARFTSAISVAAIDRQFRVAGFSSRGQKLDCSGPGVDIISCRPGGNYISMSGTSMACPFVAGLMACYFGLLMERGLPLPKYEEMRNLLGVNSVDLGQRGADTDYGPGWIAPTMLASAATPAPPPIGG